jgi:hypothetical protein
MIERDRVAGKGITGLAVDLAAGLQPSKFPAPRSHGHWPSSLAIASIVVSRGTAIGGRGAGSVVRSDDRARQLQALALSAPRPQGGEAVLESC